ncbi:DNA polymerase beta superfamily protein, partial [Klebsiella pneumoniae]|uniref:DNA polymerase beta superfamily protein n=1 Tax=Klebsiella pneumoniae TaxID=573 RepID=UPI003969488C
MGQRHPVNDEMRVTINVELDRIEKKYGVKIIYACESGSRGWGFASTNSDYDVRFIYVNHPSHYVRVYNETRETFIEKV